jgi:hypothetical protein
MGEILIFVRKTKVNFATFQEAPNRRCGLPLNFQAVSGGLLSL